MSRRVEQMRAMVAEYEASGLPRRAFCAEHGLAVTTLDYWRRELANRPQLVTCTGKTVHRKLETLKEKEDREGEEESVQRGANRRDFEAS